MSAIEEIEKTLLALPLEQRVVLAEVERREQEIESGQVRPLAEVEFWKRVEAGRKR